MVAAAKLPVYAPACPDSYLNMLVPVMAALIALAAALAGYTMVKFYGVIFLGQPREESSPKRTTPVPGNVWACCGWCWVASYWACFRTSSLR